MSRDIREIEKSGKGGPIAFADNLIINDSSLKALEEQVGRFL